MSEPGVGLRDVRAVEVLEAGRVARTEAGWWTVLEADGVPVEGVDAFVADLAACGCSPLTARSYCYDLLRWFRFLDAVGVRWQAAQRTEVRDFVRWLQVKSNPQRRRSGVQGRPPAGSLNAVTGKQYLGEGYAPRTVNHALAVLASFYDFALWNDLGCLRNPVPKQRGGAPAHRSQLQRPHDRRAALRQKETRTQPRDITEEVLQQVFAALRNDRDRALVAVALSSGARAGELLSMTTEGLDFGRCVFSVVPKGGGGRRVWIPAAPDSFVWISRYLRQRDEPGAGGPLWLTQRPPTRPLTYFGLRQVLERLNSQLGTNLTWHDFRHTFSHRLLEDDAMSVTDVSTLLRQKNLDTLSDYANTRLEVMVTRLHRHLARPPAPEPSLGAGYDTADMRVLFPGMNW